MTDLNQESAPRFFARQATGLTREVSWRDALIYNLLWSSLPLSLALILAFGPAFYPTANPYGAVLVALVLVVPCALLYTMFSSAVPRSGGDYTWISRSLSPAVGFMSSLSFFAWVTFFIGVYSTFLSAYGITPFLRVLAAYTNSTGTLAAADWFGTTTGGIVVGLVVVVGSALVLTLGSGLRTYMKMQKWVFALWAIGAVLVPILLVFFVSKATFAIHFNEYIANLGGPADAYDTFVASAPASVIAPTFGGTLLMATLPFYTLGFIFQSAYFGGEIKRARKTAMRSIVGALLIACILLLVGIAVFSSKLGDFMLATGAGDFTAVGLSSSPQYPEIAAIASGNAIIGLIISLGMLMVFLIWIPQSMILLSRSMFAWSFDRLLPQKVSEVNPKTHSPIVAVVVITVLASCSVVLISLNPDLTFVVGLLGLTITYLLVSIAGIMFPYRQREVFESSPFNRRVGGVPLMSIVAAFSTVFMIGMITILLLDENSGTSWGLNNFRVILCLVILAVGFVAYYVIKAIQKSRGIDLELAYKEIPPE